MDTKNEIAETIDVVELDEKSTIKQVKQAENLELNQALNRKTTYKAPKKKHIKTYIIYITLIAFVVICLALGTILFITGQNKSLKSLEFTDKSLSLKTGIYTTTGLRISPDDAEFEVTYSSSDETIATVDEKGIVTAHKMGEATITVESGGLISTLKVNVQPNAITTLEINGDNKLNVQESKQLSILSKPISANETEFVWQTSDDTILTVDSNGKITGIAEGTAIITLKDNVSELTAEKEITVEAEIALQRLTFDSSAMNLEVGVSATLSPQFQPKNIANKQLTFESSDAEVVSVDENGKIIGVSQGTAIVTATYTANTDFTAEIEVTVIEPYVITTPEPETSSPQSNSHTGADAGKTDIEVVDGITYVNGIMIANKTYSLPESYAPGVDGKAANALVELQGAAAADGIVLYAISDYRPYSSQERIYNNYVSSDGKENADRYSARPGHSEHQTGLAFDLNSLSESFGETAEGLWLAKHCGEYGFIIRYAADKEDITGYMYEPWHIRYLGKETAKKVIASGLSLEEYLGIDSEYKD